MAARISLLHATYRAGDDAVLVRNAWFEKACNPDLIEHIFALDSDDAQTLTATEDYTRVISPASPERVSAVRNWNSAAASARGDLLFVIADDLFPPDEWDLTLNGIVGNLNPNRFAFAISVSDEEEGPWLMRHPVISRKFYSKFGLFGPEFDGLYCDDDITLRAYNYAVVIDGKRLALEHRHPTVGDFAWTQSQTRMNLSTEYEKGLRTLREKWNRAQRAVLLEYFCPPGEVSVPNPSASLWRARLKLLGVSRAGLRKLRELARRNSQTEQA